MLVGKRTLRGRCVDQVDCLRMKRGTTPLREGWRADARVIASLEIPHAEPVACYHLSGRGLGLEAQNAMALRLMRLAGDASKTEAHGKIAAAPEQAAATKVVPESAKRSTKRVRANMRRRSK
jgi:hypothetical protein